MIEPMQHFGNKPDTLTSAFNFGFQGQFVNHPPDNRRRKLGVFLYNFTSGQKLQIGTLYFDGSCVQTEAVLDGVQNAIDREWLPDDVRVIRFIDQYAAKIPNLGALQLQREYPMHLPWCGGVALIPGDIEIV